MKDKLADKPLKGITVLDLSRLLPGPLCSLILKELGASVIKIEKPQEGDYFRWIPPFYKNMGISFFMLNRGKKSLALNLKSREGVEILKKLVRKAEVLIESFRPGVMDRLGIGYEELAKENPSLIYCSISGYGQKGPYNNRSGHDINYTGYAGILGMTKKDQNGISLPGFQISDIAGGALLATISILSALIFLQQTGKGQYIDVSMTAGAIFLNLHMLSQFLIPGFDPLSARFPLSGELPNYAVYKTRDGKYLTVGLLEPIFWKKFCQLMGFEKYISKDPAFLPEGEREKIREELEYLFSKKDLLEWMAIFENEDLPIGVVLEPAQIFNDPQFKARELLYHPEKIDDHPFPYFRFPVNFSEMKFERGDGAPQLGEHTEEILMAIGYCKEEIQKLRQSGAVE